MNAGPELNFRPAFLVKGIKPRPEVLAKIYGLWRLR